MIEITKEAKENLLSTLSEDKIKNVVFKVVSYGFGWGGPRLGLVQSKKEDEKEEEILSTEGLNFVIEKDLEYYVKRYGTVFIDYSSSYFSNGISVKLKNAFSCWISTIFSTY